MNMDIKVLNRVLINEIWQHTKMIICHDQVRFIAGYKISLIFENQLILILIEKIWYQ